MPDLLRVTRIRFSPAPPDTHSPSLLGYVSFSLPELGRLDGISLRKTGENYSLVFPSRRDRAGRAHPYFHPKNPTTRVAIERAVIDALRARGELS